MTTWHDGTFGALCRRYGGVEKAFAVLYVNTGHVLWNQNKACTSDLLHH